jgi:hypothetical protein
MEKLKNWWNRLAAIVAAYELAAKLWVAAKFGSAAGVAAIVWVQGKLEGMPTSALSVLALVSFAAILGVWRFAAPVKTTVIHLGSETSVAESIRLAALQLPNVSPEELSQRHIRGRKLRLYDVPRDKRNVLVGKIFEDCIVEGPAIVTSVGAGNNFIHTLIDTPSPDATFIGLHAEDGMPMVGVIGLAHCQFLRCKVVDIAFIGPPAAMEQAKASILSSAQEIRDGLKPEAGPRPGLA